MKLKTLKKALLKSTAVFFAYCFSVQPVNATTITDTYKVEYTKYPQQQSNWCWVASAECSGKHLRYTDRTQTGAVTEIKGGVVNETGTIFETAEAAEYFTHGLYDYVGEGRRYPCELFTAQLMNNYIPIAGGIYYENGVATGGHATPVHSVQRLGNGIKLIGYYDPDIDKTFTCSYEAFCDGSYNDRQYGLTCYIN